MTAGGVFKDPIGEEEKVLARLRLAGELDAPPASLGHAVKAAFSLRALDAELAALTYDSAQDERSLAGVRDAAEPSRFLTFEAPALTVEVEATPDGDTRRLVGQLTPPVPGPLIISHAAGTVSVELDPFGRFSADGVAPGPISVHCEAAAVTTEWVII